MKQNYEQLTTEMSTLNISEKEQIELLKSRIILLEKEARRKQLIERYFFIGFISILLGLFLIVFRIYLIGLLFIVVSFLFLAFQMISLAHSNEEKKYQKDKEKLSRLLNTKFK